MTVRLIKPYNGKAIGDLYTGNDENVLEGNQIAVSEPGGSFWGTENTMHVLGPRDGNRDFVFMAATAVTVRVPKEVDQLPYGIIATYRQGAAGAVSIIGDAGVTVTPATGVAKTAGQGAVIQITKTAARSVTVIGSTATA